MTSEEEKEILHMMREASNKARGYADFLVGDQIVILKNGES
jgi:hypothetical protein